MRSEDLRDLSPPAFLGKIHDGARAAAALALLPRPWVFTTNYDLFNERAMDRLGR